MKALFVNRAFGHFRIPVFVELRKLFNDNICFVYSEDVIKPTVKDMITEHLGTCAIGMKGEKTLVHIGRDSSGFSNRHLLVKYQPGLLSLIRYQKPDVVITEGFSQWALPAIVYRTMMQKTMVVGYQRTYHTERYAQWYRRFYRRMVAKYVDAFYCNGSLSKEYIESMGVNSDRIVVSGHATDVKGFMKRCSSFAEHQKKTMRKRLGIRGTMFLCVGRLIELKGIEQLIDAWYELGSRCGDATLVLVGDGPQREALEAKARRYGLDNVRFIGKVEYDNLYEFYSICDVFVIPTLEDNWSVVVMEAMASGLPIMSSIYNGCYPELVHKGVNGAVFDPFNKKELALKMRQFIGNQPIINRMGDASREIIRRYTPGRVARAIYEACRIAMDGSH
jgi:glycosyltransferase involved in cell wall biosynthesis